MLKGIVPPMITPFTEEGRVDLEALGRLVEFLSPHVGGLFVTGSYGSGPLMTDEERGMVTAETIRCVSPGVPVVVMVGSTCTSESVALARKAERAGASAVAAVGPYYFKYDREALVRYYGSIVDAVGIPVYVYNNPRFQGYPMEIETIEALQARGVLGVKDATFDMLAHAS